MNSENLLIEYTVSLDKPDSMFETEIHNVLKNTSAIFHGHMCEYEIHKRRKYKPDFVIFDKDKTFLIECKGRLRDRSECDKYLAIKATLEKHSPQYELVFVFQDPTVSMPDASLRKNGTRQSVSDWAERQGFKWFNSVTLAKWAKELSKK